MSASEVTDFFQRVSCGLIFCRSKQSFIHELKGHVSSILGEDYEKLIILVDKISPGDIINEHGAETHSIKSVIMRPTSERVKLFNPKNIVLLLDSQTFRNPDQKFKQFKGFLSLVARKYAVWTAPERANYLSIFCSVSLVMGDILGKNITAYKRAFFRSDFFRLYSVIIPPESRTSVLNLIKNFSLNLLPPLTAEKEYDDTLVFPLTKDSLDVFKDTRKTGTIRRPNDTAPIPTPGFKGKSPQFYRQLASTGAITNGAGVPMAVNYDRWNFLARWLKESQEQCLVLFTSVDVAVSELGDTLPNSFVYRTKNKKISASTIGPVLNTYWAKYNVIFINYNHLQSPFNIGDRRVILYTLPRIPSQWRKTKILLGESVHGKITALVDDLGADTKTLDKKSKQQEESGGLILSDLSAKETNEDENFNID